MAQNLDDHCGIFDRRNERQGAAALRTGSDVDGEHENEVGQVLVRVENTLYGILPEDPWNIEIQLFFRNSSILFASVSRKTSLFFL